MVGVLAAAALTHPALARAVRWEEQRVRAPGAPGLAGSGLAASGLAVLTFGVGVGIYGDYRAGLKRELLAEAFALSQAFEVKEHLAFSVVVLAVAGAGLMRAREETLARTCYRTAAGLSWVVVGIGWVVAGWG